MSGTEAEACQAGAGGVVGHARHENADYFLVQLADTGAVYVAVFTDIARTWDVSLADFTRRALPPSQRAEQVKAEAYRYALAHPQDVCAGLAAEAEGVLAAGPGLAP